jgi:hypothetical protein
VVAMNRSFDLSKVWFVIRKVTPKRYNRLSIYRQRDKTYKLTITDAEKESYEYYDKDALIYFSAFMNHEFLHAILMECVSIYIGNNSYDKYLEAFNRYTEEAIKEEWI